MQNFNEINTLSNSEIKDIRKDFPMLKYKIENYPLVYLDNAATTHKPFSVINCVRDFDSNNYGTVRRGVYKISEYATKKFEKTRKLIAEFLGVDNSNEIIFTSGATQSINLVAYSFSKRFISEGDEIIITNMEHHANIVPWQIVVSERKAILKVIPINDNGELILEEYEKLLSSRTKIVSLTYVSNSLGTINPIKEMIKKAHNVGAKVLLDGAQSTPHMKINLKEIDCDFYVFSSHKIYGPTGVGVLYGKYNLLEQMPPYVCGGEMINQVSFEKTTYALPPHRFEAGTPAISQIIALGEAIKYIEKIGLNKIEFYEQQLLKYATKLLSCVPGLKIIGNAKYKSSLISFHLDYAHSHDIVTILDQYGLALRGGHHCSQPVMKHFNLSATTRASMSFYNTYEELDILAKSLEKVRKVFLK